MWKRIGPLLAISVMPTIWASPAHAQAPCSACGPGTHWVDTCAGGSDTMTTRAEIGIDFILPLDCWPDTSIVLTGPVTVIRSGPLDVSANFAVGGGDGGHPDILDTEMRSMSLIGAGGITLRAGIPAGLSVGTSTCSTSGSGLVPKSCGVIQELPGPPARWANSFFEVYFQVEISPGSFLYNDVPVEVEATISCVPPRAEYIKTVG